MDFWAAIGFLNISSTGYDKSSFSSDNLKIALKTEIMQYSNYIKKTQTKNMRFFLVDQEEWLNVGSLREDIVFF